MTATAAGSAVIDNAAVRAPAAPAVSSSTRFRALDVLRGIAIVGMILVNNQGSGAHAFFGMSHADWNGWNPADLVFPLFLFVVGGSMALSMARRPPTLARVVRRAALLFAIGLAMNAIPPVVLADLRIMGVLQRIGLAYLLASLVVMFLPERRQWQVGALVLLGYAAVVGLWPIRDDFSLPGVIDRSLLGQAHVYKNGGYDPEGLLSTLTATVSVLAGFWAVTWLRRQSVGVLAARRLAIAGLALVVAGQAWGLVFPINKRLWTSSFVVLMAGLSVLVLALCYWLVEVREVSGLALEILGVNALAVYIGSEILTAQLKAHGWRVWLYDHLCSPHLGFLLGSLIYALVIAGLWWLMAYVLWKKRVFIKV